MGSPSAAARDDNHAWPDRAVGALAARQATIVGHAQLCALGIPRSSISAALARGRLYPVHHGVHSLVPPSARPRLAAEHAALLACGPAAVISHQTAARLHGLRVPGPAGDVHVALNGADRGRGRPRLHVHRTADLPRGEIVRIGGLPVTSLARTLLDLAPGLDPRALENLADEVLRRTSRAKLLAALARRPHRPGAPALRAILDPDRPSGETRSRTEARLRALFVRAGVPAPEGNVAIGRLIPDMLWRQWRVIVEYDSDAFHFGPAGYRRTWERHNHFQAQGFDVIHVTWDDLCSHRERILVRVAAALVRAGWAPE